MTLLSVILMLASGPFAAPSKTWRWPSGAITCKRPSLIGSLTKASMGFLLVRKIVARELNRVGFLAWVPARTKAPLQWALAKRLWRRLPAIQPIHASLAARMASPTPARRPASRRSNRPEKQVFLRRKALRLCPELPPPRQRHSGL